jgi:Phasin protein
MEEAPMTHTEARASLGPTTSQVATGDFVELGAKRIEAFMEVQKQLVEIFEQLNRDQLVRAKQETELASELAGKVTSARSIPDIMNAYQEWISKRMTLFTEDGRKLFEDSQQVIGTTMRLLSNGK